MPAGIIDISTLFFYFDGVTYQPTRHRSDCFSCSISGNARQDCSNIENCRAWDAENNFILLEVGGCYWRSRSVSLGGGRHTSGSREIKSVSHGENIDGDNFKESAHESKSEGLPTPRPRNSDRKSLSCILGLMRMPASKSHERKASVLIWKSSTSIAAVDDLGLKEGIEETVKA